MRFIARLIGAVGAVFRRRAVDAQLDEELQEYLAAATEAKMAQGVTPHEARRLAAAEMGSRAALKERMFDVGWESYVETLWQDVRYAVRMLRRSPGFSSVAIITFALGIGANVAVFSILDATLLKPLPFAHADRLVDILEVRRPGTAEEASYSGMARDKVDVWRAHTQIFDAIELEKAPRPLALGDNGDTIRVAQVSAGVFPLLGVAPVTGRQFSQEDMAAADQRVLLISDGLWKRAFGAAPDIVGRDVVLADRTVTIVGVMPPHARFPVGSAVDAWLPLSRVVDPKDPTGNVVGVVARLREGLTMPAAQVELARAAAAIQRVQPSREPWTARVQSIDSRDWHHGGQPLVLMAFGAVAIVLLTACANIASLLLARTSGRQREMAIRAAVGASRARLVRQLLVDSLVLALAGGAVAVALASWLIPAIPAALPPRLIAFPVHHAELDWRVLVVAFGLSCAAGAVSGILPALRGSRRGAAAALAGGRGITGARDQRRMRNLLVGTQVAFACVLLVAAGLMTTSLVRLIVSDPGYRLDGLLAVSVLLPDTYKSNAQRERFFSGVLDGVRGLSDVSAATIGAAPPDDSAGSLTAEDQQRDSTRRAAAALIAAGPDYFSVLDIPIVAGRPFSPDDREGGVSVAVIDEETARWFWPGESALGKRVRYSPYVPWMTVVGIARDVKTSRAGRAPQSFELYVPVGQASTVRAIIFRATRDARPALTAVRTQIKAIERDAQIRFAGPVRELYGASLANPRLSAIGMATFASLALLTAAVGLYGVLSYGVARRTPEIGVRMALGANRSSVRRLVLGEALMPVAAGILIGLATAQVLARAIAAQLYRTPTYDPITLTLVVATFAIVALVAAYVPSRRATRVDPLVALRAE